MSNLSQLGAAPWPWSRTPDRVTAECAIEPSRIEQGATARLRARVRAVDTRKHPLAYVWSTNGGELIGSGETVEVDASRLNPGVYSVLALVQDAYHNQATCVAHFQVALPTDQLTASCSAEPPVVEQGKPARVVVEARDLRDHPLRFIWFANGGSLEGQGSQVEWRTDNLSPGTYVITTRVEDDWGHAADCVARVEVRLPAPPPPPLELANLAQFLFARNQSSLGASERQQLQTVFERLQNDSRGRVSIEAYAGPDEANPAALAAARAHAVKRLLVEAGIPESRIQVQVGLGGRLGGLRNRTLDIVWIPDGMDY